jgi:hypothetical protein
VLQNNGADDVTLTSASATLAFPTRLALGQAYAVSVKSQTASPAQHCVVSNAKGTVKSDVTITVECRKVYYVNCANGSNTAAGGPGDPWKTVTKAIATAASGPVEIVVAPNSCSSSSGEVLPLAPRSDQHIFGTAVGSSTRGTTIFGDGVHAVFNVFQSNVSIEHLLIVERSRVPSVVLVKSARGVLLDDLAVTDGECMDPLEVDGGAEVTLTNSLLPGLTIDGQATRAKVRTSSVGWMNIANFTPANVDLGTAAEPGGNRFDRGAGITLWGVVPSYVTAVGNTWSPLAQGADASGHYASQRVSGTSPPRGQGKENYSFRDSPNGGFQF